MSEQDGTQAVDWNDFAELHRKDDGGGLLSRFKQVKKGTLAELVRFVSHLPDDEQANYAIEKYGDHRLDIGEILMLSRRADLPPG